MHPSNFIYHNTKYEKWIRDKPCLICGEKSEVHHVYNMGGKKKRNSQLSVPLCVAHHRHGFAGSYHQEGKDKFEEKHNINLDWEVINLLSEYIGEEK